MRKDKYLLEEKIETEPAVGTLRDDLTVRPGLILYSTGTSAQLQSKPSTDLVPKEKEEKIHYSHYANRRN